MVKLTALCTNLTFCGRKFHDKRTLIMETNVNGIVALLPVRALKLGSCFMIYVGKMDSA